MKLTGRTRVRAGLFKKLVLQVEFHAHGAVFGIPCEGDYWRDARTEDLAELQQIMLSGLQINIQMSQPDARKHH